MFSKKDILDLCKQRSNQASAFPDIEETDPNSGEFSDARDQIAGAVWNEIAEVYANIRPAIAGIAPTRVADIGCGFAFLGLQLYRDFGCQLLLIDIEETEEIYFHFRKEGAGYTSLDVAREFLTANGVPSEMIQTLNPKDIDPMDSPPVDLAISLLSCGFHYPAATYRSYFLKNVTKGVILDLRKRRLDNGLKTLDEFGQTKTIFEGRKHHCVLSLPAST